MRPALWTTMMTIAAAALSACDKSSSESGITPPKDTATAALTASAPPTASATTPAETAAPAASLSAPGAASAVASASLAAASADAGKSKAGAASASALKPVSKQISGNQFTLDVSSPGCRAGEDCAVTLKLTATGEYHVNKEYPYKFLATAAPGVTFLGKTEANTFSRAAGDFVEQGEKTGIMTVRFKAASPGDAKVSGKYKLSVCSDDQCLIEEPIVDIAVPVS